MRAPNDKPERKTAVTETAEDRARAKLAALGWDTSIIEQYIEQWSEEGLDVYIEAEALAWSWNWQRRHWGRTPDLDRNQSLKDGYLAAKEWLRVRLSPAS